MAENHNNNRRKHPRVDVRHTLTMNLAERRLQVRTADLGFGGALIGSLVVANLGAIISLDLRTAKGGGECNARVLRRYRNGFAIEFLRPSADFTAAVRTLLAPELELRSIEQPPSAEIIEVDFHRRVVISVN